MELAFLVLRGQHKLRNNQWNNPETIQKLGFIINSFYNHSQDNGYLPVVVFIPNHTELKNRRKGWKSSYDEFVKNMNNKYNSKRIIFVDIYKKEFEERYFNIKEFEGHASPYGNKIIAQAVLESVRVPLEKLKEDNSTKTLNLLP